MTPEKLRKNSRAYYARHKDNPEFRKRKRAQATSYWERVKADPEILERVRARQRAKYQQNRLNPEFKKRRKAVVRKHYVEVLKPSNEKYTHLLKRNYKNKVRRRNNKYLRVDPISPTVEENEGAEKSASMMRRKQFSPEKRKDVLKRSYLKLKSDPERYANKREQSRSSDARRKNKYLRIDPA